MRSTNIDETLISLEFSSWIINDSIIIDNYIVNKGSNSKSLLKVSIDSHPKISTFCNFHVNILIDMGEINF
jgi:hypothetical protein